MLEKKSEQQLRRSGRLVACLILGLSLTGPAHGASQGSLGAPSVGTVTITASIPARTRISGISDIAFDGQDSAIAFSRMNNACIWTNARSATYKVTASGSGQGGAFVLSSGAGTIPYTVSWSSGGATDLGTLTSGAASSTLISAATQDKCDSEKGSASLRVAIDPEDLAVMDRGSTYVGALTVLVSPE